jgi:hypothetical protein
VSYTHKDTLSQHIALPLAFEDGTDRVSFWVFPRRLSANSRRFGTLYRIHLQRQVKEEFFLTCLWRWNRYSVPKRRLLALRRRGITQKKTLSFPSSKAGQWSIYYIDLPLKMDPIQCSETSAISTQTPRKHPKENIFHVTQGESLKSRNRYSFRNSMPC